MNSHFVWPPEVDLMNFKCSLQQAIFIGFIMNGGQVKGARLKTADDPTHFVNQGDGDRVDVLLVL